MNKTNRLAPPLGKRCGRGTLASSVLRFTGNPIRTLINLKLWFVCFSSPCSPSSWPFTIFFHSARNSEPGHTSGSTSPLIPTVRGSRLYPEKKFRPSPLIDSRRSCTYTRYALSAVDPSSFFLLLFFRKVSTFLTDSALLRGAIVNRTRY